MSNFKATILLSTTATILGLNTLALPEVEAATITYNFEVTVTSGPLDGESYFGSLTYDNSTLTNTGQEFLEIPELSMVEFNFMGMDYTEADDPNAAVKFFNGDFLGLDFVIPDPDFSIVPGIIDLSGSRFNYTIPDGSGSGSVDYAIIPEGPSTLASLFLTVAGMGLIVKRRKSLKS